MSEKNQEFTVRFFKMRNGEEFISCIDDVILDGGNKIYKCLEPSTIVVNPEDHEQLAFQKWCMFSQDRLMEISSKDLMFNPKEVDLGIANSYKQYFLTVDETEDNIEVTGDGESNIILPGTMSQKMQEHLING